MVTSSLGLWEGGLQFGRIVCADELPYRPHVDDASVLFAASAYRYFDHAVDAPGRVVPHRPDRYGQDPGLDRAFEVVDVFGCDAEDQRQAARLGTAVLVGRVQRVRGELVV